MKTHVTRVLLAALVLLSIRLNTTGADNTTPQLVRPVMELYPQGPIGGGLTRYGNAIVNQITEDHLKYINVEQPSGNNHWMIRWFPRHKLFAINDLPIKENLMLAFEIRSKVDRQTAFYSDWQIQKRSIGKQASKSQSINFTAGQWRQVILPIAPVDPGIKINGLCLRATTPGTYTIRSIELVTPSSIQAHPLSRDVFLNHSSVELTGMAQPNIPVVHLTIRMNDEDGDHMPVNQNIAINQGTFKYKLQADQLKSGKLYHVQWQVGNDIASSINQPVFAYYQMQEKQLAPATVENGRLMADGKPLGFLGLNYTKFQLGFSNHTNFERLNRHLLQLQEWGVNTVRLTLNMMMIQPAPGIYPDSEKWAKIIKAHKLDARFIELLDYHIKLAGELGIYTIFDWHEYGTRPYRYFVGGMPSDKKEGKPGTALAWLAPDNRTAVTFDYANSLHRKALLDCHTWLAKHFKNNPNIMGIEVPFNEPHDQFAAVEANLRQMIDQCAQAVKQQDPNRLTFAMTSSYSHDNATATSTWLKPDRADGMGSHFYMANGPVPLRPDAKKFKQPWLARDVDQTFYYGTTAVLMPFTTQLYPQYNGEDGDHGFKDFLPGIEEKNASRMMIENGIVKNWMAGQVGYLLWTMHDATDFKKFNKDVYTGLFKKYAPLFKAGPVDYANSKVLFIQNPAAHKISNGHNYSCVPIAKLALDLHLNPVHYMSDDQFMNVGVARYAKGLEQVQEGARDLNYKAVVLDTRNCDQRVIKMVQKMKTPTLITDDIEKLTVDPFAKFLKKSGVLVDQQTPTSLQLMTGPQHVVIYNHTAKPVTATAYPRVSRESPFKLITTDKRILFNGTRSQLQIKGITVNIASRTSLILSIE